MPACIHLDLRLRSKLDSWDAVQETLLKAKGEVARQMGRSKAAVAKLLQRGAARLSGLLQDLRPE
jgi:DNA-directed RNA polymerase specialized sigma24 family protein